MSRLCHHGRTVDFNKINCVVKENRNVTIIGERPGGIYSVELRSTGGKSMITPDASENMLCVWHSRLAHADKTAIKQTMVIKAVIEFDKVYLHSAGSCSLYVELTMRNTAIKSRTTPKTRPGAALHTNVVEISVTFINGARHLVTFIDEASGYVNTFHKKTKANAAKALKFQAKRVERQTANKAKKVIFDVVEEYLNGRSVLDSGGTYNRTTAYYTSEASSRAERMNRTIKYAVRTMLIHSGAPANIWAECLYNVCEARSCVIRVGTI